MGVISTAVEHLIAAGVTGAALVQAIADMEAAASGIPAKVDAAEKRRAYDRERKRKEAAEKKALSELAERNSTGNSTGNMVESAESGRNSAGAVQAASLSLSPNENNSNPHTHTHPDNIPTREAVPFEAHVAAWLEWQATKPKRKQKAEKPEVSSGTPDRPEDVSEQVWADFLKHRRKHGGLTATALKGFRREADRVGWPLERAIEESILRNWRGFKADWVKTNDRNGYGNSGFGAPAGSRFQPEGGIAEGLRRIESARNHSPSGEAGRWDDYEPEGGYLGSGS